MNADTKSKVSAVNKCLEAASPTKSKALSNNQKYFDLDSFATISPSVMAHLPFHLLGYAHYKLSVSR